MTFLLQFAAVLVLGLLAWVDLHQAFRAYRRQRESRGTWPKHGCPFTELPGFRVDVQASLEGAGIVEEHFVVAINTSKRQCFKVHASVPNGTTRAALAGHSLKLFESLIRSFFTFKLQPAGGPWPRATLEQVAASIACLGPTYGPAVLEARPERLVLTWVRLEDAPQPDIDTLLARAREELLLIEAALP